MRTRTGTFPRLFAKAFDSVNHDILLRKLNHYVPRWFQSYFSGRKQTVRISAANYVLKNITCGVSRYHYYT